MGKIEIDETGKNRQRKRGKDIRDRRREDIDKFESTTRRQNKFEKYLIQNDHRRVRNNEYTYEDDYTEDI